MQPRKTRSARLSPAPRLPPPLPPSPPSPQIKPVEAPALEAPQKPANWMPEDDRPELQHIPNQYGVPACDFNWTYYWYQQQLRREQDRIEERKRADLRVVLWLFCIFIVFMVAVGTVSKK